MGPAVAHAGMSPPAAASSLVNRKSRAAGAEADVDDHQQRVTTCADDEQHEQERTFTRDEISRHDTPNDCWLIINGRVYDVTSWVPRHPGGNLIFVNAGNDCTQLFESYHPLHVRKMLGKFCIGRVATGKGQGGRPGSDTSNGTLLRNGHGEHESGLAPSSLRFQPASDDDALFYPTLKERVEKFFKEQKINPRVHPHMFVKTAVILLSYFACFLLCFFCRLPLPLAALSAALMGFFAAEVGVSIQHDCNHGAYSTSPLLSAIMGVSLDLVGASSFMWKQQHVVGHHVATNINNFDPDIRVKDPDVRRVTSAQPGRWFHQYQHIYLALLYGLLALKSVFLDDFSAYFSRSIGPVKLVKMTPSEEAIFWGMKALYAVYMLALPLSFGVHPIATTAALFILSQLVTGWTLALMFQVAHVVGRAEFPEAEAEAEAERVGEGAAGAKQTSRAAVIHRSWAALQVATTTDFSHGSFFWTHVSGGLNYQIEHHLFPGVCHVHYPTIQPIVKQTCREFGVPYHCYPTFWDALCAHFAYLKKVGVAALDLRLNG